MGLRRGRRALVVGAVAVAVSMACALPANAATSATHGSHAAMKTTTIADNIVSPLGLAVAEGGTVYVAQSFIGGLTAIRHGQPTNIVENGGQISGVDVTDDGTLTYLQNNQVVVRTAAGATTVLADLGQYEAQNNPDAAMTYGFQGLSSTCAASSELAAWAAANLETPPTYQGQVDSNAYAVATLPNGDRIVADAAGNDLIRVPLRGEPSTLTVFGPRPVSITPDLVAAFGLPTCVTGGTFNFEFVPTDVEVDQHGMLWVTSLPGGPEADSPLGARGAVFMVNPNTGEATLVASGFAGATDLAVAPNGTIYVTELFANQVSMVTRSGTVVKVADITEPLSIEWAKGRLYVGQGLMGPGSVVTIKP